MFSILISALPKLHRPVPFWCLRKLGKGYHVIIVVSIKHPLFKTFSFHTYKHKAGVNKLLPFEERFREVPFT